MNKKNIIILLSIITLIQGVLNIYLYNNNQLNSSKTDNENQNVQSANSNAVLTHIAEINEKLTTQNKILYELKHHNTLSEDIHPKEKTNEFTTSMDHSMHSTSTSTKELLINNLYEHDITLNNVLSDPRLKHLSKADRDEFYKEIVRKIDSGEINKSSFLPGYTVH